MSDNLTFGFGNAKLSHGIATFSLPAGYTCPFAKECLAKANRLTGKLIEGKHCRFRCFSASQENVYKNVRAARWHNFDLLRGEKSIEKIGKLIQRSLPYNTRMVRVHVSGDFYNEMYFLAWLNVAMNNPLVIFYGYTKATPFLVKYRKYLPSNFKFVASKGGTHDALIGKYKLKNVVVVFSPEEAEQKGLEIDHDDSHAFMGKKSFAVLIHGTQPPGSEASKAWTALRKRGIGGYGDSAIARNKNHIHPEFQMYITIQNGELYLPKEPEQFTLLSKQDVEQGKWVANLPSYLRVENGEFSFV